MLPIYPMNWSGMLAWQIKPVRDICRATSRWTCQQITTALVAANVDLVAVENPFTDNAEALIIERLPFSYPIGSAQDIESLFGREFVLHSVSYRKRETGWPFRDNPATALTIDRPIS